MKALLPPSVLTRWFTLFCLLAGMAVSESRAVGLVNVVRYDPLSQGVSITLPTTFTYVLNVTAPLAVTDFPLTVNVRKVATYFPLGDANTALSYIRLSTDTLTFTSAGQTLPITVTADFPVTALSYDVPAGAYTYQIYTDGWPALMIDNGATINSSVSLPVTTIGNPPTIAIDTPADGSSFVFAPNQLPAQITFHYSASTDLTSPLITNVSAMFGTADGMVDIPVSATLGLMDVAGTGTFTVTAPGTYLLQASATNLMGTATDTNTYVVTVTAPPPTVAIASPTPGSTYTYRLGDPATVVPLNFTAKSSYGGIRTLTVDVDGNDVPFNASGIGTLTATGSILLPYAAAGAHSVTVTTTDDNGSASAQTNFTIGIIEPLPAVSITTPTPNQVFTIPTGSTTMSIGYSFTTTVNNGFNVDTVSAALGNTVLNPTTTGLGTPKAVSTGTMILGPGTYTLTANGGSTGRSATASVSFTVKNAALPPSVVINTPAVGYTQAIVPGTTANIPLTFTGTSNTSGAVIYQLTATLDGTALTVSPSGLWTSTATGSSNMAVTTAGTHHIVVTAKDIFGTATATRDFTITFVASHRASGTVFFDLDGNGAQNGADFGLAFVSVKLLNSAGQVVGSTVTDAAGAYTFAGVYPGTYSVSTTAVNGLIATTATVRSFTMGAADVSVAPIGYRLNFCALRCMTADGYTIGYWKNNVDKAIAGKTSGIQVSAAKITQYTKNIAQFALAPFDGMTMKNATKIMGSTSSSPADLLAKQLLASEYNYQNGAYLSGNATLTFAFVAWGEAVLQNSSSFSSSYVIWVKDWFDAYNNSHGGIVAGPLP